MTEYDEKTLTLLRELAVGKNYSSGQIEKETGMLAGSVIRVCRENGIPLPGSGRPGVPRTITLAGPKPEPRKLYEIYADDMKLLREDPAEARDCMSCKMPRAYGSRYCKKHYRIMYVQSTWREAAKREFQAEQK